MFNVWNYEYDGKNFTVLSNFKLFVGTFYFSLIFFLHFF